MVPFDVDVRLAGGCSVVRVTGELDLATTPQLEAALARAEGGPAAGAIVVDLSGTIFCDSTGMTAVLRAHKRARTRGGALALVCPESNRDVHRVLRLLGLDRVLPVHEELDAAVGETRRGATAEP